MLEEKVYNLRQELREKSLKSFGFDATKLYCRESGLAMADINDETLEKCTNVEDLVVWTSYYTIPHPRLAVKTKESMVDFIYSSPRPATIRLISEFILGQNYWAKYDDKISLIELKVKLLSETNETNETNVVLPNYLLIILSEVILRASGIGITISFLSQYKKEPELKLIEKILTNEKEATNFISALEKNISTQIEIRNNAIKSKENAAREAQLQTNKLNANTWFSMAAKFKSKQNKINAALTSNSPKTRTELIKEKQAWAKLFEDIAAEQEIEDAAAVQEKVKSETLKIPKLTFYEKLMAKKAQAEAQAAGKRLELKP